MTEIERIKKAIAKLERELKFEESREEILKDISKNINTLYKVDHEEDGIAIGKILGISDRKATSYNCNEIRFSSEYLQIIHGEEIRYTSEVEFISKEEFDKILNQIFDNTRKTFS